MNVHCAFNAQIKKEMLSLHFCVNTNIKWELKLLSSGLWHYVILQADTDILKEHALSIFRVQELAQLHIHS
jgi:hypothetical protein